MKKILFSFFIVLFGGVLIVNSQCKNHLSSREELQCGSTDCILLTRNPDDVNSADSVVWSENGRSVHLYKYDKEKTNFLFRNEYDHVLMRKYIDSEEVLNCCKVMQIKLLNSLNGLSRNQLDALLQDTLGRSPAFLIDFILDNDGNIQRLKYSFFTTSEERLPDSVIREIDKNISSMGFPPVKDFGINFAKIAYPIRKDALREYVISRYGE